MSADDMRETVTALIGQDPCRQKRLRGKAAALEAFVENLGRLTAREKRVSIMTALAVLLHTDEAKPSRVRAKGIRKRFHYYLPFVGRVCKRAFLACYRVSAVIIARYKARLTQSTER
jgi:hypothetical protein